MEQKVLRRIAATLGPVLAGTTALAVGLASPPVKADAADEALAQRERCATRLSVSLLGDSPNAALLASANPQSTVDGMLGDAAFVERFARFVNAEFNVEPGAKVEEDASYTLAKHVLTNNLPWKDMFVGQFDVTDTVTPDPNGLGYFRSADWMKRYAGNEGTPQSGYRIVAAYRILQNTTGLKLTATTAVVGLDVTATGRQAAACAGCHYNSWYALDKVAKVLSKRAGTGNNITFTPPTEGPQQILDGQTIADDKALVDGLVASEDFKFNVCRIAFKYLYARPENTCEGTVFDKCVDAFTAKGTMQSAISAIATDPTFCQ